MIGYLRGIIVDVAVALVALGVLVLLAGQL